MFGWREYGQFPAEGYSLVCIAGEAAGGFVRIIMCSARAVWMFG